MIKCLVKSLIATFVEIQLQKENLKTVFWMPKLVYRYPKQPGYVTGIEFLRTEELTTS